MNVHRNARLAPRGRAEIVRRVVEDIKQRLPATLELVLLTGFISVALGIPHGIYTAVKKRGIADRVLFGYGMLAGSFPDFQLGLILIFVFFSLTGILPEPIGQLDPIVSTPPQITGATALDALLGRHWQAFRSAVLHPYSRALLSSVLYPDPSEQLSRYLLRGEISSPIDLPSGCHLHGRCPWAVADCNDAYPDAEELLPGRQVACFRAREMNALNGDSAT